MEGGGRGGSGGLGQGGGWDGCAVCWLLLSTSVQCWRWEMGDNHPIGATVIVSLASREVITSGCVLASAVT